MSTAGQKNKPMYGVVAVLDADRNGNGRFILTDIKESYSDAVDAADKLSRNHVAVPLHPSREYQEGDTYQFGRGDNKGLDAVAREFEWQRENNQPIIACKIDRRDGTPWVGMNVKMDSGRDHMGRAEERNATSIDRLPLEQQNDPKTYYAAVERFEGREWEGKVIGLYESLEDAKDHADQRSSEIQHGQEVSQSNPLEGASFSSSQNDIAQEYRNEQHERGR